MTTSGEFIEGIGSLSGLLEISHIDLTPQLDCYLENGIALYKYYPQISCDLINGIFENRPDEVKVNVYPNPMHALATLDLNFLPCGTILTLYDLPGNLIKSIKLNSRKTTIDRSNIANGIYIYKINFLNSRSLEGKLVIN